MSATERIPRTARNTSENGPLSARDTSSPSQLKQTHVWLTDDDVALLDDWAYRLRRGGWQRATRSACVRALITILHDIDVDVSGAADEAALADILRHVLTEEPQ